MNEEYAYGMWVIVAFNIGLFLFFILSFIKPSKRVEWRNMGIVMAFLVALFTEMYGFPLTIYLLTGWLGDVYPALQPFSHKYGHLWVVVFGGSTVAWLIVMTISLLFMLAGYTLMSKGWTAIHGAHGQLVTQGVYAYVRHPQYTGLYLLITGFLIQWPTILTVLMAPALAIAYLHLSHREEQVMREKYMALYDKYCDGKPLFFPSLSLWWEFLTVPASNKLS